MMRTALIHGLLASGTVFMGTGCRHGNDSALQADAKIEMRTAEGRSYEVLTGCEKEEILESYVKGSVYTTKPSWSGKEVAGIFTFVGPREENGRKFLNVSMEHASDITPPNREKLVHTYGSVAAVRFVRDPNSTFTGVLAGAECGIFRAAPGAGPSKNRLVPGIALKFLVDGKPSVNIFALYTAEGQEGVNYFKNTLSNFLAPPVTNISKFLTSRFNLASKDGTKVHAGHLARVQSNGRSVKESDVRAAEQLYFVPNTEKLAFSDVPVPNHDYRDDLESIPVGTKLYDVYGRVAGASENERTLIGYIETKTKFLSSEFGDKRLFFKHQRVESTPDELRTE